MANPRTLEQILASEPRQHTAAWDEWWQSLRMVEQAIYTESIEVREWPFPYPEGPCWEVAERGRCPFCGCLAWETASGPTCPNPRCQAGKRE